MSKRPLLETSLAQLTLVRFKEYWREPEAIFWSFVFPILLTAGLALAFQNRPAESVRVGAATEELAAALRTDSTLSVRVYDRMAGEHALRIGQILVLAAPTGDGIEYRYDDTNAEARHARLLIDRALQRSRGQTPAVAVSDRHVREPGSRYVDFVVPGLLGMNLMGSGIWGIGFTIVDARRKKLLKRLVGSPMPRWQYLVSLILARMVLLVVEVGAIVAFAVWIFEVPLRGNPIEFAALCLLVTMTFSSLGLLIGSRVQTIEAASGLMNFVMLPMWVLSGIFFSPERFPEAVLPLIRALPLTAAIDALRSNMLQGLPISQMHWQIPVVLAWTVTSFFLALRLFRWR